MANKLPTFDRLINPLLRALEALGGSGAVDEIYEKVIELEKLPEDVLAQLHDQDKSNQTEVGYRLAWARTYLKKYGLLENSTRGVWSLTAKATFGDGDRGEGGVGGGEGAGQLGMAFRGAGGRRGVLLDGDVGAGVMSLPAPLPLNPI